MKELEYKHFSIDLSMADIGALCTWLTECKSQFIFDSMPSMVTDIAHSYILISNYICTLTRNCFDIVSSGTEGTKSITTSVMHQKEILMTQKIKITEKCRYQIIDLMHKCEKQGEKPIDADKVEDKIVLEIGSETSSKLREQ